MMSKKQSLKKRIGRILFPDLTPFYPAGYPWKQERNWMIAGLSFSFLYALSVFGMRFEEELSFIKLPEVPKGLPFSMMPNFAEIFDGCLVGFLVVALAALVLAVVHYQYHYRGSKSIYLMRRLPDRKNLWIRCLAGPAFTLIFTAVTAFLTLLFFFGIYHLATPEEALRPGQWEILWNTWR